MEFWISIAGFSCAFIGLFYGFRQTLSARSSGQSRDTALRDLEDCKLRLLDTASLLREAQNLNHVLNAQSVRLETELQYQRSHLEEKIQTLQDAEHRLGQTFQTLSSHALRQTSDAFLQLAHGVLSKHEVKAQGDLDLRRQAVEQLVEPIHRSLGKVEERIQDLEKQRVGAYQGLQEQVSLLFDAQKKLQIEAANLSMALRSPTTRGRWGELQLKRVVELAGMLAYCDFYEQTGLGLDGRLRPDMVIRLPGNRSIVIDAKVPLLAYLDAVDCADEERRREHYKLHAMQVRKQVQALAQKAYWEQLDSSPEFVLLFLPGEAFYSAALQADPSLIEVGADHRVLIATPTILIALLRTAAHAWRQEDIAKNAQDISRLGKELYQRICDVSGHIADMGKSLGASIQSYNKMIGTIESRVLVSARRFQELKADDPKKEIREAPVLDELPRILQSLESIPAQAHT
ncbi:MAG: DNA recombination protein RmuC [Proteobacteria bacterium]|nr:DNA recombination protein RmuC [Pseudomonadota bacterium]